MARCRNCKEKFEPVEFLQKFCKGNVDCLTAEGMYKLGKKKEADKKKWNHEKREMSIEAYSSKHKIQLQKQINLLARNIDTHFGYKCVDCGKDYGKQADGSHFNNVQGNENIRYNLHNIHKAKSDCNQFHGGRKRYFYEGLIERYGKEYAEFVDKGLSLKYPELHLSNREVYEKLAIVRKLNRDFKSFQLFDGVAARDMFNELIGIYKK